MKNLTNILTSSIKPLSLCASKETKVSVDKDRAASYSDGRCPTLPSRADRHQGRVALIEEGKEEKGQLSAPARGRPQGQKDSISAAWLCAIPQGLDVPMDAVKKKWRK